jgi:hypothetical protein
MSTIPPNWLGSIIQSHDAQRRADANRSAEQAAAAERARDPAAVDRNIIENDDTDSSVYSDAEGAGSQGRSHSESESEPEEEHVEEKEKGVNEGGLDIQA